MNVQTFHYLICNKISNGITGVEKFVMICVVDVSRIFFVVKLIYFRMSLFFVFFDVLMLNFIVQCIVIISSSFSPILSLVGSIDNTFSSYSTMNPKNNISGSSVSVLLIELTSSVSFCRLNFYTREYSR